MAGEADEPVSVPRIAILGAFPRDFLMDEVAPRRHYATWLVQVAKVYAEVSGFEFHWVVVSKEFDQAFKVKKWGQTFHCLPAATGGTRATTLYREERKRIQAVLADIKPALVHGWGTEDIYALATVLSGYPHLVSMQGILTDYVLKNRVHLRDYLQALLELFVLYKAQKISVESEWGRKVLLRRNFNAEIHLVEYGVDERFFNTMWKPNPSCPVALFVGTVCSRKGTHDLVEAFADPALAGVELRIVGNGSPSYEARLKERSTPNVKWLGRLSGSEIAEQMSQAWALLLPTWADTSPNVVKEARVIGLPVITTPNGGQTTYVKDGVTGYLVAPGDVPALVNASRRLFSQFELCQAMGRNLQEEQRAALHPQETARRFLRIYSEMIGQG